MDATPPGPAGSGISMHITLPKGGAGQLTLDPAGVETLISYLEQALDKLREIYRRGGKLLDVDPPGDDPFSPIAVADIKRTAGEEPGGHLYANMRAQQVFQAIVDNLRASLQAYHANDVDNAEKFAGGT